MLISAIILTHNEEKNISRCLDHLSWCSEILVIDDNSTDNTVQLAKSYVTLYSHPLENNFAAQHNFALKKARGDWVLFVDADEIVSPELASEILAQITIPSPIYTSFHLKRQDIFHGKPLRFGETGGIKLLRLAKKNAGQWVRPVHERWEVSGLTKTLNNPLLHSPHPTIADFIFHLNRFTSIDATVLPQEKKGFKLHRFFLNPVAKFIQNFFFRLGFLDGFPGFVVAFMMSLHSVIVRIKLYENKLPKNI